MKKLFLFTLLINLFVFSQSKYESGSDNDESAVAKQIKKEQQVDAAKKRAKLLKERERILKDTETEEKKRIKKIDDDGKVQNGELTVEQDIPVSKGEIVPIRSILNNQIDKFISHLKLDLEKTTRLDVFNSDLSSKEIPSESKISLVNPKPLPGQSKEDFKKELLKQKDKARAHTVKAMIVDVSYGDGFESNFGSFIYEKVSQELFYTQYPQEIDFVSCYRCIYNNEISVTSRGDNIHIEKNKLDVNKIKQLQKQYKLDMYGKIFVSYENRMLRFQILFYSAKTNQVIWSRTYIYSINSLTGKSFTMDLGANFMVSLNKAVGQNPIGGDFRFGGRFLGVGSAGFKFYIGSGFKDQFGRPQLLLLNGFFDFFITDLLPYYDNRVAVALGVDTGIGIQTFLEQPMVFYNLGFSLRVNFVNSAYIFGGVVIDVGQNNAQTQFNSVVGPSFIFGIGVIVL